LRISPVFTLFIALAVTWIVIWLGLRAIIGH